MTQEINLTPKQILILKLIDRYRAKHGCSPTISEIAQSRKVSRPGVHEMVNDLIEKGALVRPKEHVARGLLLTKAGKGVLA